MVKNEKPLGRKAYGSIGHLPNSRLGPTDSCVEVGMARICTEQARDKHDRIIVQEKLDGSCCAVAKVDGKILALGRAGYLAATSPFEQHHLFADWVASKRWVFERLLMEGERIVGEWCAQAHGTVYDFPAVVANVSGPFFVFDLMVGTERMPVDDLQERVIGHLPLPHTISDGPAVSVAEAMRVQQARHWECDQTEGVVYRVERKGEVDFLAKWVRPNKVDGKHLPEISGREAVWNWRP